MKRICSILLSALLLFSLLPTVALAADDAADLHYELVMTAYNKNGVKADTFAVGEMITLELALRRTGAGVAPLYALQGELCMDTYNLRFVRYEGIAKTSLQADRVSFAYLDMSGNGVNMADPQPIGKFYLQVLKDGTVDLMVENLILTNRDSSDRSVSGSAHVPLVLGDGVRAPSREALGADITAARARLKKAVVADQVPANIYYPDFWVTTATATAFREQIEAAQAVFDNEIATAAEVEAAIEALSNGAAVFELELHYGPSEWISDMVTVTATVGEHGSIAEGYDRQKARKGTAVTVISKPDPGYDTEYVTVNGVRKPGEEIYTLQAVKTDTKVHVTFCPTIHFADVAKSAWYYRSVRYAVNQSLFQGTGATTFSPDLAMNRAMLATVLYRLSGSPQTAAVTTLSDVERGSWYASAVDWAVETGVMTGVGDNRFGGAQPTTREQVATVLYRYAKWKVSTLKPGADLSAYADAGKISPWAQEAMAWANAEALVTGTTPTTLNPGAEASRGQVATILMRYLKA